MEKEIDRILCEFFGLDDVEFDTIQKSLNLSTLENIEFFLDKEKFYKEYIIEKKSIKEIAANYSIEKDLVEFIWAKHIHDYYHINNYENKMNLDELIDTLLLYLSNKSIEILQLNSRYMSIQSIKDRYDENLFGFKKIKSIFKINDINVTTGDILRQSMNLSTYTWNAYRKDKDQDKVNKTFIKYYDNNYYGLAEWSDEVHKQYFMDAIEEYTVNSPNEKKAKDILKLFKDLEIEDKQDYIEIIEGKIKRAFN